MAVLYTGTVATPRMPGNALATQRLFALENRRGSNRLLRVRRLSTQMDATVALTAVKPQVKTTRGSGVVLGGAQLDKGTFDTAQTSDDQIRVWFAPSSDLGISGEVISTPGTIQWQQYSGRMHTLAEQVIGADENQMPRLVEDTAFNYELYPGQHLLVTVNGTAVTGNPATNHWILNCVWTEEDFVSFTISGVVTLSAVPVVGAEVLVVVADNVAMDNAYFHSVQVTGAGGTWSAQIPVGKLAFAYAQNDVAGTKYTSPGRPYQA